MIRAAAGGPEGEALDMRFLDNLKISVKILSVVGLLSAVTALVVILGAFSLHSVDQTYTQLAAKEEPAVIALARGASSINIVGYAAYRAIAYPGASPEATAAAKSVEFVTVNQSPDHRPSYVYRKFEGSPLESVSEEASTVPNDRVSYLLSQRASVMP